MRACLLLISIIVLTACAQPPQFSNVALQNTLSEIHTDTNAEADFIETLNARGVAVTAHETVSQSFLSVAGRVYAVNGARIQVYSYLDASAAYADRLGFSPDGAFYTDDHQTRVINWIDSPYLYQSGRLLVIYVGSDAATLTLLADVFGVPFAGGADPYSAAVAARMPTAR